MTSGGQGCGIFVAATYTTALINNDKSLDAIVGCRLEKLKGIIMNYFEERLPEEMRLQILQSLPSISLGRMAMVNRNFRRIADDSTLWTEMTLDGQFLLSDFSFMVRDPLTLSLRFTSFMGRDNTLLELDPTPFRVTSLNMEKSSIPRIILSSFLKRCPHLTHLNLSNTSLNDDVLKSIMVCAESLTFLDISFAWAPYLTQDALIPLLKKMTKLKVLRIASIRPRLARFVWSSPANMRLIIESFPTTLEELDLSGMQRHLTEANYDAIYERCRGVNFKLIVRDEISIEQALFNSFQDWSEGDISET